MGMGTSGAIQWRANPQKRWNTLLPNCFDDLCSSESSAFQQIADEHFKPLENEKRLLCLAGHYNIRAIDIADFLALNFTDPKLGNHIIFDRITVPRDTLVSAEVQEMGEEEDDYGTRYKVSLELYLSDEDFDPDGDMAIRLNHLQHALRDLLYYSFDPIESKQYRLVVGFN